MPVDETRIAGPTLLTSLYVVVIGPAKLLEPVQGWRKNLGSAISPETAALLSRSLRTLVVRVQRHNETARAVAEAMARHPAIARTLYPGLPDFPGHNLAARQMHGFGRIVTIEIDGDRAAAVRVADGLQLFQLAPSLGGAESLVTRPRTTMHFDLADAERARRGITDGMLRLSIGLEDARDLIADLQQALA